MVQTASSWGRSLQQITRRLGVSRAMRPVGVLDLSTGIEETTPANPIEAARLRAFRVCGRGYAARGLHDGDRLLVDATLEPKADVLVMASMYGRYVLERRSMLARTPIEAEIVGALVGIIRKRGFIPRGPSEPAPAATVDTKSRMLAGRLRMLEATRASTRNPRLERALRDEAARVRKQIQIGANLDKPG